MDIQEVFEIRKLIANRYDGKNYDELKAVPIEDLIGVLNEGRDTPLIIEDLDDLVFLADEGLMWKREVRDIWYAIEREDESLARVEQFLGKPLAEAELEELETKAIDMFIMPLDEYKEIVNEQGIITVDDIKDAWYYWQKDSCILLGYLKKIGQEWDRHKIREKVLERELGLGYFQRMFELHFTDDNWMSCSSEDQDNITNVHNDCFVSHYNEFRKEWESLQEFDAKLKEDHKIEQPVLLEEMTIDSSLRPYSLNFTKNGQLVVMGQLADAMRDNDVTGNQFIAVYNVETGERINQIDTGGFSAFRGAGGMVFSYDGEITIGSDGYIYLNGGIRRFNNSLEEITNSILSDEASISLEHVPGSDGPPTRNLHQMVEKDGTFYFSMPGVILVGDKNGHVEEAFTYAHHSGGSTKWNSNPRIIVTDDEIIYRESHLYADSIMAVKRDLSEESIKNPREIIGPGVTNWNEVKEEGKIPNLASSCRPSKYCIGPDNNLYVLTELPEEPVPSVKVHDLQTGELLTHFYPEGYPGGWANFRDMAIRDDGLIAVSDTIDNKIHFYRSNMPEAVAQAE